MKFSQICMALLAASQVSACATAIRGTKEDMVVQTDPEGARVYTSLETPQSKKARRKDSSLEPETYGCPATPCEFTMPRNAKFLLTIEKPGYEPVTLVVEGKLGKSGMTANLASTGGAATVGIAMGASAASFGSSLGVAGSAGVGAGVGAVTAGIFLIPLGVDAVSGAMLNHNPNPIYIVLPPEGTVFEKDPKVAEFYEKMRLNKEKAVQRKASKECVSKLRSKRQLCLDKYREELKSLAFSDGD